MKIGEGMSEPGPHFPSKGSPVAGAQYYNQCINEKREIMTSEHDQLHIHFQFYAAGEGGDSLIGSPEEDAIIAWLEEELHWPQPPAEGPCVWMHRVVDEIPATRLCPALPWCDSLPRKDAEDKWSRITAMLPEWLQSYPVFEAFGFITNDNNFDDGIKGFVLREGTMTEFELPPRCGHRNS